MTERKKVSHAKVAAALALCAVALHEPASADWSSCASGEYPMVRRGSIGSPSSLNSTAPAGDYLPGEIQGLVTGFTGTCVSPDSWGPTNCTENTSNNVFTCAKQCLRTNGTVASSAHLGGSMVCAPSPCPFPPGTPLLNRPGDPGGSSVTTCRGGCEVTTTGLGLVVNGTPFAFSETVTGPYCDGLTGDPGSGQLQYCTQFGGVEFCTNPQSDFNQLCTQVNGQLYCLPANLAEPCTASGCATPENPIAQAADGSQVGPSGIASPPAPDTGVPGQPAPPDAVIEVSGSSGSSQYVYWSPSTTLNSSLGQNGGGTLPGGNPGDGGGDEPGDGPGSIDGGTDCDSPPVCEGDPVACYQSVQLWQVSCAYQTPFATDLEAELGRFQLSNPETETALPIISRTLPDLFVPYSPGPCPADLPVTLPEPFSTTVVVPISEWCTLLRILGALIHLSAGWMALRIIGSFGA